MDKLDTKVFKGMKLHRIIKEVDWYTTHLPNCYLIRLNDKCNFWYYCPKIDKYTEKEIIGNLISSLMFDFELYNELKYEMSNYKAKLIRREYVRLKKLCHNN